MRRKKPGFAGRKKGFSLLEILVALVLIIIGVSAAVAAISTGRFFLKQAENKDQAMRVALVKMEEYLAKSYSDLQGGDIFTGTLDGIDWQVNVTGTDTNESDLRAPLAIPYKKIETIAFYKETDKSGNTYQKNVQLENLIPYPFIHTASTWISRDLAVGTPVVPECSSFGTCAKVIGSDQYPLRVKLKYEVNKELLIFYNVAIIIDSATGLESTDTIYTGCFLKDNKGNLYGTNPKPVITRTPILTQPFISNVIALTGDDALKAGSEYTVEIRWYKETAKNTGTIRLREANLMVVAVEKSPIS